MSKLYIVPTPIGNLKDITFRAIETLKKVDLILAEDTRTSGKLLNHYEIKTPMISYHMHNEHRVLESVIEKLKSGLKIAIISDAGTPAISDPGFLLVSNPMGADWSSTAFARYLGEDQSAWRAYDAVALVEDGHKFDQILVDQGDADSFLDSGLRPWLLEAACKNAGIDLSLRMQPGYDHSYYFISTFIEDHLHWHQARLT